MYSASAFEWLGMFVAGHSQIGGSHEQAIDPGNAPLTPPWLDPGSQGDDVVTDWAIGPICTPA